MSSTDSGSVLHHHFDNIEQQKGSHMLGMWAFLVTEAMFFGGVMAAYTAYRIWYPKDFEAGSSKLNVLIAGINSILLLTSSLTITLAIHAAQRCDRRALMQWLFVTAFLGIAFLGFKAREYYNDYQEHLIPGKLFTKAPEGHGHSSTESDKQPVAAPPEKDSHAVAAAPLVAPGGGRIHMQRPDEEEHSPADDFRKEGVNPQRAQLFYVFYYSMTGLHVLHMVVGIGLIFWLYNLARKNFFHHPDRATSIEVMSLYWHFVDMVWFFLVALLYCAGPHTGAQMHL